MVATPITPTMVSAQDLFRAAYENRYTWDSQFPGYRADVTYTCDGQVFEGQVVVSPDPRMGYKGEVSGITDEAALKAVQGQIWEIAVHRVRRSFEQTHGQNTFRFGEQGSTPDATGAVEILMGGKAEGDRYQVKANEVSLVHRHIHGTVVTINTFSSHDTGAGYLSHRYDSVYHEPATEGTGAQKSGRSEFEDEYESVSGYSILNRRSIRTEAFGAQPATEQEFRFSKIALLGGS